MLTPSLSLAQVVNELSVDRSRGEQMQINLDITLHRMGCSHISIDVMDVSGDYHLHVDEHEILKQRIDLNGNRIRVNPHKSKVSSRAPAMTVGTERDRGAERERERSRSGFLTTQLFTDQVGPEVKPHGNDTAGNGTSAEECQSCYGAEEKAGQCCNTCDEVRDAYRKKGWALGQATNVKQCEHDEYLESLK